MADDIVPELLEAIQKSFADFVAADADITALLEKVAAGTATHAETEEYALLIGEYAASALKINLTAETLPDGTLYYNIAERTIPPTLQQSYEMVTDVATQVQQTLNEAAGIGIKPITAELDTERVEGIVNTAVNAENIEAAQKVIGESVVNITQSFADDFVQSNAEFHYQAGLKPTITRKVVGGCCDWCMSLAGTYEYGQHPKDIFRRHKNCRCTVTYDPGDGSKEDVWTKKPVTSSADAATIEERKTIGIKSLPEELAAAPGRLSSYTPSSLKDALERAGLKVKPLAQGRLKGITFEDGGGFKVNFSDGGLLQYHPEKGSHHDGAYYKISTGKGGTHRYGLDGTKQDN
ncbi:MAG: hypothetical protein LUE22_03055 [Oscillospiraceae bacterium]|nr:hypothetical protein [Oscillospiraceae bacterium]